MAANRNPAQADPSGHYWGAISGRFYACQGNTLTGREVIVAMAKAYEETRGSLADRLMAALIAGCWLSMPESITPTVTPVPS